MSRSKPSVYLTFADPPNGIFKTQVVDVVELLKANTDARVTLISFISFRGFFNSRKTIKSWCNDAIVLPMIPLIKNWRLNSIFLRLALSRIGKSATLLGRGVFATNLLIQTFRMNDRVVYDGRGAIWAEAKEFNVYGSALTVEEVKKLEQQAILKSDWLISVSQKLVEYWSEYYDYHGSNYSVIPCSFKKNGTTESLNVLTELEWSKEDLIFVYAGSNDGWQGMRQLKALFTHLLNLGKNTRLLLLMKNEDLSNELSKSFPNQVARVWLKPELVSSYLAVGDYGILIRPENITNQVASPVKFAEYLSVGLKVLISSGVGDYSEFVRKHNVGHQINNLSDLDDLEFVKNEQKEEIKNLAKVNFSKDGNLILEKYLSVLV